MNPTAKAEIASQDGTGTAGSRTASITNGIHHTLKTGPAPFLPLEILYLPPTHKQLLNYTTRSSV